MSPLTRRALASAAAVSALGRSPGKHPRYDPHDLPSGVYSATTDPRTIRRWWARWPQANVAIATRAGSGVFVVDVDLAIYTLPATATVRTAAGHHAYLVHPGSRVRNNVRLLPGLDLRGDHGLAVAPPSLHASGQRYSWETWREPALAPAWLLRLMYPQPAPAEPQGVMHGSGAYARAALDQELRRLARAPVGFRNDLLNWIAFRCGQFVGCSHLRRAETEDALLAAALAACLSLREARATIRSGITAGIRTPPRSLR